MYNSNGEAFQTFDGILDFAITHCDQVHPDINFGLERIIPTCEHSAVYNTDFKGFVDYQLIRKFNASKLSDANLLITIRSILDKYGRRRFYPVCKYNNDKEIDKAIFEKCQSAFKKKTTNHSSQQNEKQCLEIGKKLYEDKWVVNVDDEETEILNTFASPNSSFRIIDSVYYVDIQDVSVDTLRKYIISLPKNSKWLVRMNFLCHHIRKKLMICS